MLIDLTMPIADHFRWPVDRRQKKSDTFQVTWVGWTVHGFTHVDAPRHLYLIPREWFHEFAREHGLKVELDTTRDVGSMGLNYYGWYLAVRNVTGRRLPEHIVCRIAQYIANRMRSREEREGHGCSYTIALRKP